MLRIKIKTIFSKMNITKRTEIRAKKHLGRKAGRGWLGPTDNVGLRKTTPHQLRTCEIKMKSTWMPTEHFSTSKDSCGRMRADCCWSPSNHA
jgi:hypothetical protein